MITGSLTLMYAVGLLIGLAAGFVMHRADFCLSGAFRDAIFFGATFRLRALFLLIVTSMLLFEGLRRLDLLPLYPFPLLASPSVANIIGGFFFGIGMVLAGGCVVGTLYKMGSGSVISATAFAGLILGSGLYAELHPRWAAFAKATAFLKGSITAPQALGVDPGLPVLLTLFLALPFFYRWHRKGLWQKQTAVAGYLQPWQAALCLAVLGAASYLLVGMPLGVSTTYAKIAALLENLLWPEHVKQVLFFNLTPLHVVHPASGTLLHGGAGPALDAIWLIQMPIIAGIVLGSMISALTLGEFSISHRPPGPQLAMAFAGGIILALASRMTPGCNVWHLLGGLPIFALQSILFFSGLLPGTWVGSTILMRLLRNPAKTR